LCIDAGLGGIPTATSGNPAPSPCLLRPQFNLKPILNKAKSMTPAFTICQLLSGLAHGVVFERRSFPAILITRVFPQATSGKTLQCEWECVLHEGPMRLARKLRITKHNCCIALLFVALEKNEHFALAEAFVRNFDAGVVLFGFGEGGRNRGVFNQMIGINLSGFGFVQEFQDFIGSCGGSSGSEMPGISFVDLGGVLAAFLEGADASAFAKPALKAALTPYGQVLFMDGDTIELSTENFFYDGQFVEPREDFGAALAVEEALVELSADVVREAGDFAGEGVFGGVVVIVWLRRFRRDVNQIFVVHSAYFSREWWKYKFATTPKWLSPLAGLPLRFGDSHIMVGHGFHQKYGCGGDYAGGGDRGRGAGGGIVP
jgi:hypothetical protein